MTETVDNDVRTEFIEELFTDSPVGTIKPDMESLVGLQVNDYVLVELVGKGGMSLVYKAAHFDPEIKQEVAVKILNYKFNDNFVLYKFLDEQVILSQLNHPNIARFINRGIFKNRKPFMIMEFVKGTHIDKYCVNNNLSHKQRITLFKQLCGAVSYAHSQLIVHCDIKTENVLVREDGSVCLVDFGVSSLMSRRDRTNVVEHLACTPAIAAPELLKDNEVSIATDVYQLGLLLFKVLTGENLYDLNNKNLGEIRKYIEGELSAVVAKCLHQNSKERYESVEHLVKDIESYETGFPVAAFPYSNVYAIKKWFLRNRTAVISMVFVFSIIALFSTYHIIKITEETAKYKQEALKNKSVLKYVSSVFEVRSPFASKTGKDDLGAVLIKARNHLESDLGEHTDVKNQVALTLAKISRDTNRYEQAKLLLQIISADVEENLALEKQLVLAEVLVEQELYEDAKAVIDQLLESDFFSEQSSKDNFEVYLKALYTKASVEKRMHSYGVARSILQGLLAQEQIHQYPILLADVNYEMGKSYFISDPPLAAPYFEKAAELYRVSSGEKNPILGPVYSKLGYVLHHQGKVERAEYYLNKAIVVLSPYKDVYPRGNYGAHLNSGIFYGSKNDYSKAYMHFKEAEKNALTISENFTLLTRVRSNLAWLHTQKGEYREAKAIYRDFVNQYERGSGFPKDTAANGYQGLAAIHAQLEDYETALGYYQAAYKLRRSLYGEGSLKALLIKKDIAHIGCLTGNVKGVKSVLADIHTAFNGIVNENSDIFANLLYTEADCSLAIGDFDKALSLMDRSIDILRTNYADDDRIITWSVRRIDMLANMGRDALAVSTYKRLAGNMENLISLPLLTQWRWHEISARIASLENNPVALRSHLKKLKGISENHTYIKLFRNKFEISKIDKTNR